MRLVLNELIGHHVVEQVDGRWLERQPVLLQYVVG